jgi:hypothetical protein
VGSTRAVYTHELAAADREPDEGTEEVIANLTAAVGAPSTSFVDLAMSKDYGPGSWYVDAFADLDAS